MMTPFETKRVVAFIAAAEAAGFICRSQQTRGKFLIELCGPGIATNTIEFYRPDEPRFGRVRAEQRDHLRDVWAAAKAATAVADRASEEFEYYLRIYEPYRNDNIEFSAIADCVIRLYELDGRQPPARSELVGDLSASESAYDLWRKR
jgi:hypothetical protein